MSKKRLIEKEVFPRKRNDDYRVGVVYPNRYYVGMSNLGFQWLIHSIEKTEGYCCERIFIEKGAQKTISLESGRELNDFHILAFSISFEFDFLNLIRLLQSSHIPLYAHERSNKYPLLIAGGTALQVNPAPVLPLLDIAIIGEGEKLVEIFLEAYLEAKDRQELFGRLNDFSNFYCPGYTEGKTRTSVISAQTLSQVEMSSFGPPFSNIISSETEFSNTLLVEISRGCPMGCRFCWAGYRYIPMRPFNKDSIIDIAKRGRRTANRIGLVSTAVCQHPEIEEILSKLSEMGYKISLSSLRLSDITEHILKIASLSGLAGIAIAPESGSDLLRAKINKGFTNDEILDKCAGVFKAGIKRLKLYFLIGLPEENFSDIENIVKLVKNIHKIFKLSQKQWNTPGAITVSINPFVPKPNTPFQYAHMDPIENLRNKINYLKKNIASMDGVKFQSSSVRQAHLQWALSMGGSSLIPELVSLVNGETSIQSFLEKYTPIHPQKDISIDWGLNEEFLLSEWQKVHEGKLTPPCPGKEGCTRCGICKNIT